MKGNLAFALRLGAALGLVAGAGSWTAAHAGGLYVPGLGPIAQSRAGAYVASAEDPSALAVNPAGLANQDGVFLLVGSNFLDYALSFQRRGAYDPVDNIDLPWEGQPYGLVEDESSPPIGIGGFQAVPMIVVGMDLEKQVPGLHVAVGVFAPSAYPTRDISSDYVFEDPNTPPPPGRYDIITQEAAVILPSIAAAYRVNEQLDVGARFSPGFAHLKAKTMVWGTVNYEEWSAHDAEFLVDASDNFVPAFGLGVLFRPTDAIEIGVNWDSQVNVHSQGTGVSVAGSELEITPGEPLELTPVPDDEAKCAPGGQVGALKACVDIGLPMVTTVGARYKLRDAKGEVAGDVELNVAWERWSAVSDHHVIVDGRALTLTLNETDIVHNFDDVISVRLGGSYRLPMGLGFRAGVAYDTAAAPEGWERLDLDGAARVTMAAGASYRFGKTAVHVGGGYVHEGTREVGTDCNTSISMQTCSGDSGTTPPDERVGPDPAQPLNAGDPFESPFNAGTYTSSYVLLHLAVTTQF